MASTFKTQEDCNEAVDDELAKSVTELFLNGMDEEKHSGMVKDDQNHRPEKCDGLVPVCINKLILDATSTHARYSDKKDEY